MSEREEIRELDDTTVERIAAGEVVERPASAVKELLENALDADASRIHVAVESGGKDAISVSDDGVGMTESQVRTAVREHTTSKIRDIADLEGGVGTLGFRGEALHAIGAVSRVTITTRPQGGDHGTRLRVEGGEVTTVEPAGCPEGTTVTVEDLFYNVPARRKYLSQDATEFDHVNSIVTNYALANPAVAVELEHDGRETFATSGQGSIQETIMAVYGREVAESMIEVRAADLPAGPLTDVSGLVSDPETTRAGREYLSTFVNGRFVRSNAARDAVIEAYDTQLSPDRYPFAVLNLSLPADVIDVNVHPRKMEVRFAEEAGLREQVRTAVENALLREGLVRSSAPRGRSAPDQTTIEQGKGQPAADGETDHGTQEVDASRGVGETKPDSGRQTAPSDPASETGPSSEQTPDSGDATDGRDDRGVRTDTATAPERTDPPSTPDRERSSPASDSQHAEPATAGSRPADSDEGEPAPTRIRERGAQTTLGDGENALDNEFDSLPSMRVLGQFRDTYVVAETDTGLVLIDQHAADERINYERLTDAFAADTTTQALAEPVELSLTAREAELFERFQPALEGIGFTADRTDEETVAVSTVPTILAGTADPELLREVLASFVTDEADPDGTVEAAADELLADLACYPSITGNTSLTDGSIVDLLERLDECENPYACPHGRPVVIEIDAAELAERFERDYPGHTTRRFE
ncbi:DNA mismatch repair endonuclease MutL [Halorhabdus sp. CUG00001]|uniref:DNA mismatch repair endonuclease MutL n=1 Tax=Halorhabdus sp. CUG00001 TaxID=2600297 RepID=UPI00131E4DDB|nr:DNA mismatch repair endonuclease MutL [Halorhabdus sp. CUG00001]